MTSFEQVEEVTETYHMQCLNGEGLEYYRGLGIKDRVILSHRLGWVHEPLVEQHEQFVGLHVVPYLAADGRPIQVRVSPFTFDSTGRHDLLQMMSAYPLAEPRLRIFNVGNALPGLRTNRVLMVVDVLSTLILRGLGRRSVAVPGWDNFHPAWFELFRHSEVVLCHREEDQDQVMGLSDQFRRNMIDHSMYVHTHESVAEQVGQEGEKGLP